MSYRNVLVTGANRGIGLEFIKQLLGLTPPPKNVIATTRKPSEELNGLLSGNNNLHIVTYDASNFDSYPSFVSQIEQVVSGEGLDLLINNAGIYVKGALDGLTPQDLLKNIEVNSVAPIILTRDLLSLLKLAAKEKKTTVVNVSSLMGSVEDNGSGGHYAYRASKAALNMMSKSLAVDLKASNIIVLPVHPGHVRTDMGGPSGKIDTYTCVNGLLQVIRDADLTKTGQFLNYDGKVLPW